MRFVHFVWRAGYVWSSITREGNMRAELYIYTVSELDEKLRE